MRPVAIFAALFTCCIIAKGQQPQAITNYPLPDSVKAVSLLAAVQLPIVSGKAKTAVGIQANGMSLDIMAKKGKCEVRFTFPAAAQVLANGLYVSATRTSRVWTFEQAMDTNYQLMIASVGDSSENFMLYSGYIYFPQTRQWKLIGTCQLLGQWTGLKAPSSLAKAMPTKALPATISSFWCQRSNGSWKRLSLTDAPPPVLPPFSSMDSVRQFALDSIQLQKDIAAGKTDVRYLKEGVFYAMMQEGTGRQVAVTDTVSVFYKGYLYANGKVFDQTKEKPARFPLNRLIKGWQLGLPLCKVGGKIKLVILSGQAYSIRTRAAKIPPNSILVFEIEVVKSE